MNLLSSGFGVLLFVLASTSLSAFVRNPKRPIPFVEVDHATIHPAEFTQPIHLSFESAATSRDFTKIRFRSAKGTYTVSSAFGLRRLNSPDAPDFDIPYLPFDKSQYFRIGRYTNVSGKHTLLFFSGDAFASDASALLVIGFDTEGLPYKLLEKESLELTAFILPTNDKPALIVGKPTLSQVQSKNFDNPTSGPYATTYDPFAVYVLSNSPAKAIYSLNQSRLYNQQHYVWIGPHSSEKTLVYYKIPSHPKPFTAPASDLNKFVK